MLLGPKHAVKIYEIAAAMYGQELAYHEPTLSRMKKLNSLLGRPTAPGALHEKKNMTLFPSEARVVYPCSTQWSPIVILNSQVHIVSSFPNIFKLLVWNYFNSPVAEFLNLEAPASERNKTRERAS